ncbi:type II toxin-antitoxin system RelE/ParE family toxin [Streptococcus anginosus]|uniref:Type II toxin-antitoxin system RelE/ParE family toxin n=1 Tax=Streptococcus anginosus TaxID=1328 RepID=A0A6G4MXX8_STRAP|nr:MULTISPECIES: type II toxin-antitoxin system RelE/ParE family toxin [Streptococcus]KAA9249129.1 type II toxin-antitoxin system RelE/ParE family toxin [Streptococcus anginosus]KAA9260556.1 type II toxin-antitoxin system RelE/ParE family toxin [Streptococcus anginosus]KAA9262518.1 type II toxin-antitoxin system RelE/ParE family toxin [Streptococcus anginosus]KAA9305091.1 type II toxin-antitoxin system RelE/ParE family toxin [Streptococcus anginosus]KAA9311028.1 type II toxin-antitoxin system 
MAYKVIASKEVEEAIDNIHDYIATVLLSPQSAKNTVTKILDSLKSLEIFPEAGFDADERIGVKINSKYLTRGKIIGQYVLLYFVIEEDKVVFLSHLFHTKSDYVNLLRKSNKKSSND